MKKSQQAEGNRIAAYIFYGALAIIALFAVYSLFMHDAGRMLIESSRAPGSFSR